MSRLRVRMKSTPESSNMDAYGYLQQSSMLFIRFKGGQTYCYTGVPKSIFSDLRAAASKGIFFNRYIKTVFESFMVDDSPVEFVDEDTEEVISALKSMADLPRDTRWAW